MTITDEQAETMCKLAYKQTDIKKGQVHIQQGDLFADKFYIVQEGSFEIYVASSTPEANGASAKEAIEANSLVTFSNRLWCTCNKTSDLHAMTSGLKVIKFSSF